MADEAHQKRVAEFLAELTKAIKSHSKKRSFDAFLYQFSGHSGCGRGIYIAGFWPLVSKRSVGRHHRNYENYGDSS
jgi:hypothetical protein